MMGKHDDVQCPLTTNVHHNAVNHRCGHHNAENRIEILLKTRRPRFILEHIVEDAPICVAVSGVAEAMVTEPVTHAATNVVQQFMQTLAVL